MQHCPVCHRDADAKSSPKWSHLTAFRRCPLGSRVTANSTSSPGCSSSAGVAHWEKWKNSSPGRSTQRRKPKACRMLLTCNRELVHHSEGGLVHHSEGFPNFQGIKSIREGPSGLLIASHCSQVAQDTKCEYQRQWTEVAVHLYATSLPNIAGLLAREMLQPEGHTYGAIGGSEQRKGQGSLLCMLLSVKKRSGVTLQAGMCVDEDGPAGCRVAAILSRPCHLLQCPSSVKNAADQHTDAATGGLSRR